MKSGHGLQVGDLVRYVLNPNTVPPHVIPDENPLGIVLGCRTFLVGNDPSSQAVLETVRVWWNDPSWNPKTGSAEEYPSDLQIVQSLDQP